MVKLKKNYKQGVTAKLVGKERRENDYYTRVRKSDVETCLNCPYSKCNTGTCDLIKRKIKG